MERDDVAKLVIETTQVMADGYRGNVTKFSTPEDRDKAEACAVAVINSGVFILLGLGLSMDDIKERMVSFRNSQSCD